jgi:hypothetical protein
MLIATLRYAVSLLSRRCCALNQPANARDARAKPDREMFTPRPTDSGNARESTRKGLLGGQTTKDL